MKVNVVEENVDGPTVSVMNVTLPSYGLAVLVAEALLAKGPLSGAALGDYYGFDIAA